MKCPYLLLGMFRSGCTHFTRSDVELNEKWNGMDAYFELMNDSPTLITEEFVDRARKIDQELAVFLSKHKGLHAFSVCW
jgi:hypothetical protein